MMRSIALISEWTLNRLRVWQEADECIRPIREALLLGGKQSVEVCAGFPYVTNRYFLEFDKLRLENGVECKVWFGNLGREERLQLVVPNKVRHDVLTIVHDIML